MDGQISRAYFSIFALKCYFTNFWPYFVGSYDSYDGKLYNNDDELYKILKELIPIFCERLYEINHEKNNETAKTKRRERILANATIISWVL